MQKRRVVVTGVGVVSPNGIGINSFINAIKEQKSGIRKQDILAELGFSCQIAGLPDISSIDLNNYFSLVEQRGLNSTGLIYGVIAGLDAIRSSSLNTEKYDPELGIIFGTGSLGIEKFSESIRQIDNKQVRRLGSTSVLQTMSSGVAAFLSGKIKAGNMVTSNSSACATGSEALLMGFKHIQSGSAKRMLVGSTSDSGPYIWGGFDALRILPHQYNDRPEEASRPMDANASGFVPSSGAGALVLEDLESALERGAKIYAEVLGGFQNSGGQVNGGSMTAPNPGAVISCIQQSLVNAELHAKDIDLINGHLTATKMDALEVRNWKKALGVSAENFPQIQSLKGMIGHALAACGSIELVSCVLQLKHQFVFGNLNLNEVHSDITNEISTNKIPTSTLENSHLNHLIKASFGFGDVNVCLVLRKY